jgi:hypothetical protein
LHLTIFEQPVNFEFFEQSVSRNKGGHAGAKVIENRFSYIPVLTLHRFRKYSARVPQRNRPWPPARINLTSVRDNS